MVQREFIVHIEQLALKQINASSFANGMYAKWFAFLQRFVFTIQHRVGEKNNVADDLSRNAHSLIVLQLSVLKFECLKELYPQDDEFAKA